MREYFTDVFIIGSGPAGYTAAIYAARANLKPLVATGLQTGGQLTSATEVENYPGFEDPIQGPELMSRFREQACRVGAGVIDDIIVEIDLMQRPARLKGDSGNVYLANTVIVATGAQARRLHIEGEAEYFGFGVSVCATCDGFFFREQEVVVVGGGNTAVDEALYLTRHARKVTLIHRRDGFRAERVLIDRLLANPKITVVYNSIVEQIIGLSQPVKAVKAVRIRNTLTGGSSMIKTDGVFVAIGHDPSTSIFRGQIAMDEDGYIQVSPGSTRTNIPWVWAAGDCADKQYRQAVFAAGMGCVAALQAQDYVTEQEALSSEQK